MPEGVKRYVAEFHQFEKTGQLARRLLGAATIRCAACLIYEQLYNAYETFRLAVAMNGLAFPLPEHLADVRIRHVANPSFADTEARTAFSVLGSLPPQTWTAPGLFHNERP